METRSPALQRCKCEGAAVATHRSPGCVCLEIISDHMCVVHARHQQDARWSFDDRCPSSLQMCLHWLAQCFWNYLDWAEVCHYLCTCVLMGADYQVYTCVAAFKHLQPEILQQTQTQELQLFLKVSRAPRLPSCGRWREAPAAVAASVAMRLPASLVSLSGSACRRRG